MTILSTLAAGRSASRCFSRVFQHANPAAFHLKKAGFLGQKPVNFHSVWNGRDFSGKLTLFTIFRSGVRGCNRNDQNFSLGLLRRWKSGEGGEKRGVGRKKVEPLTKEEKAAIKPSVSRLSRLLGLAKPVKWRLIAGMFFLVVSSLVTISVPFWFGRIIDSIFVQSNAEGTESTLNDALQKQKREEDEDEKAVMTDEERMSLVLEKLGRFCLILAAVFVVAAAANYTRIYLMKTAGQKVVNNIRVNTFSSLIRQDMAFFDKSKSGEFVNRLSNDSLQVGYSVTSNMSDGLRSLISAAGAIGMMLYVCPKLAMLGICVGPPVGFVAYKLADYLTVLTEKQNDALAAAGQVAEERLANVKTVRAFAAEEKESNLYEQKIDSYWKLAIKEARAHGSIFAFFGLSGNLSGLALLYAGGHFVAGGALTIGQLSSFIMYAVYAGISMGGLTGFYTELMRGIGASTRLFELIERRPAIPISGGQRLDDLKGEIRFVDVSFTFPTRTEAPIFENLSFTVPAGKTTAVVGPSGSGKSTLASLALRLYDPQEGRIEVDGVDLKSLDPQWFRRQVGVVSQEPALFSTSIRDNIAYSRKDSASAADEEVREAAQQANALDFISNFPKQFDTLVGERGAALSGGQRQRVAIARALLLKPKLLILDEATSALDAQSEYLVRVALEKLILSHERTVLIIAHRLSTVKNADQIAVLSDGRVVEMGTYDELVAIQGGAFKQLVERQTIGLVDDDDGLKNCENSKLE